MGQWSGRKRKIVLKIYNSNRKVVKIKIKVMLVINKIIVDKHNLIQFNTIQYNSIQFNSI